MEIWDLYDENKMRVGRLHKRGEPIPKGFYHLVVHVLIQNDKGELLLSKRHPAKGYGNLWECTGGSVLKGETSLEGILRETKEELGLYVEPNGGKLLYSELKNTYHSDMWHFSSNASLSDLKLQEDEVIDVKWVNRTQYEKMLQNNEVVPSFKHFYRILDQYK
ncbi:NUDIX hydrolase [Ornithinibacillus halophilus]|uniref:NUDIX domain-containing protein n=1 Tax=Ornithinibacillus halophilus TaxID=930117 RepID=A0A1M5DXR9_9BACI|nr:NUDIX domain-containing protein [Ornithinibacillus halophilus]SHF71730.1 NUDIX domain-containing protein [Ornithinibacillus halophilus]